MFFIPWYFWISYLQKGDATSSSNCHQSPQTISIAELVSSTLFAPFTTEATSLDNVDCGHLQQQQVKDFPQGTGNLIFGQLSSHVSNYLSNEEVAFIIGLTIITLFAFLCFFCGTVCGIFCLPSAGNDKNRVNKKNPNSNVSLTLFFVTEDGKKEEVVFGEQQKEEEKNEVPQVTLSVSVGGDVVERPLVQPKRSQPTGMSPPPAYEAIQMEEEENSRSSSDSSSDENYSGDSDEDDVDSVVTKYSLDSSEDSDTESDEESDEESGDESGTEDDTDYTVESEEPVYAYIV